MTEVNEISVILAHCFIDYQVKWGVPPHIVRLCEDYLQRAAQAVK